MRKMMQKMGLVAAAAAMIVAGTPMASAEVDLTAKLQAMVGELSPAQQSALFLLLSELSGGSAGGGEASAAASPEAAFKAGMEEMLTAIKEADLDAIMAVIHDDFDYYQVGGKEDVKALLQGAFDSGLVEQYVDDVEINTDETEFEVDGDEITIYPVEISGPFGAITVELYAVEEDGEFLITGLDVFGI